MEDNDSEEDGDDDESYINKYEDDDNDEDYGYVGDDGDDDFGDDGDNDDGYGDDDDNGYLWDIGKWGRHGAAGCRPGILSGPRPWWMRMVIEIMIKMVMMLRRRLTSMV